MSHKTCAHIRLQTGCVYCLRTQAVYIRPDDVPTAPKKGSRPLSELQLAEKCWKTIKGHLAHRNIPVRAVIVLVKGDSLPSSPRDFSSLLDYVTTQNRKAERIEP